MGFYSNLSGLIWSGKLSNVISLSAEDEHGIPVALSDGKTYIKNDSQSSAGKYKIDLITNTSTEGSSSSYLVSIENDAQWLTAIYEGTTVKAPRLYISPDKRYLKVKLNGYNGSLTVYYTVIRLK